jgi:hypothetical protein
MSGKYWNKTKLNKTKLTLKIIDMLFRKNNLCLECSFLISIIQTSNNIWTNNLSKLHFHPTVDEEEDVR